MARIIRGFERDGNRLTIATGVTIQEAKDHCNNPETSSATATGPEALQLTAERGPWFDRWYADDDETDYPQDDDDSHGRVSPHASGDDICIVVGCEICP